MQKTIFDVGLPLPDSLLDASSVNPDVERRGNAWNVFSADEAPVRRGMTAVETLSFQGYATENDHVRVVDYYDNVLLDTYGNADLAPVEVSVGQFVRDLKVVDLTAGQLVVIVK